MKPDAIIIGGGIHGSSLAYHLAQRGTRPLVIEKDYVARHASGVNAGGVRLLGRDVAEIPLSLASMEIWKSLDEELGADKGFRPSDHMNIALHEDDMAIIRARHARLGELGYDHEILIDQEELRARAPNVSTDCCGAIIESSGGFAIPYKATHAFQVAAERLGAQFREGEQVHRLRRWNGVWIVETDRGQYEADYVINCAGAWADQIALQIGDIVPVIHSAPMLMITSRMPHFVSQVVGAVSRHLSFKQFENGTVLVGGGAQGFADRDRNMTHLDFRKLAVVADTAMTYFPIMKQAAINRIWAGLEAYMPDSIPAIGPSKVADNAFHVFGFSAHGFQLGPIVGKVMAEVITTGQSSIDLSKFAVDRFNRSTV